MKKQWIALLLFATVTAVAGFNVQAKQNKAAVEHVHYHAGFQVYIDNTLQDYTDFKYMSLSPCSTEPRELTPEEEQSEKGHLHDQIGDVVHVHKTGGTWADVFKNIGVELPKDKEIQAYNEKLKIKNILNTEIEPYQSIVFVIGDQSKAAEYQQTLVTRQHIEETEQRSELCGTINN